MASISKQHITRQTAIDLFTRAADGENFYSPEGAIYTETARRIAVRLLDAADPRLAHISPRSYWEARVFIEHHPAQFLDEAAK